MQDASTPTSRRRAGAAVGRTRSVRRPASSTVRARSAHANGWRARTQGEGLSPRRCSSSRLVRGSRPTKHAPIPHVLIGPWSTSSRNSLTLVMFHVDPNGRKRSLGLGEPAEHTAQAFSRCSATFWQPAWVCPGCARDVQLDDIHVPSNAGEACGGCGSRLWWEYDRATECGHFRCSHGCGCFGAKAPILFQAEDDEAAPPGVEEFGVRAVSLAPCCCGDRAPRRWGSPARASGETSAASTASCEPCQGAMRLSSATGTSMFMSATRTLRASRQTRQRRARVFAHTTCACFQGSMRSSFNQ